MATIEQYVEERGIKSLFHFTRLDNLSSILQRGLLPMNVCAETGVQPFINDQFRYDNTPLCQTSCRIPIARIYRLG